MNQKIINTQWHYVAGKEFGDAFYLLIAEFSPVSNNWRTQVERPSYYNGGLAIEHYIKAYLTLENIEFPKNHKGHDLIHLLSLLPGIKKFFDFDDIDIKQISLLNERYYSDDKYGKDDLRYGSKTGIRKSPHPDSLNRIVKSMGNKIEREIRIRHSNLK